MDGNETGFPRFRYVKPLSKGIGKRMTSFSLKIGRRIRQVFDSMPKQCDVNWLAAQLSCDRRNVYRIFEKENIDILLLARISRIMGHDFFADLSQDLQSASGEAFWEEGCEEQECV